MKKVIIVVVLAITVWAFFSKWDAVPTTERLPRTGTSAPQVESHPSNFKCDGREYCSQMNSRAEAEFFIKNCPNTKMDGDRDGIPCENDSRF